MRTNDKLWYEQQTSADIEFYTSDGLSLYDLQNIDHLAMGTADWFHARLVQLFGHADGPNWERLRAGYPGTAAALDSRRKFIPQRVYEDATPKESAS